MVDRMTVVPEKISGHSKARWVVLYDQDLAASGMTMFTFINHG